MKKWSDKCLKILLSSVLSVAMLLNVAAMPIGAAAELLFSDISFVETEKSATESVKPPSSLDDIKIPSVTQNPYDVDVSVSAYPIYSTDMYNRLNSKYFSSYATHTHKIEGSSQYFTAAITPWFD